MGDHRAEVKLEMTLHGKTYKHTFDWINWDIYGGCDRLVTECFEEWSRDALNRWEEENWKAGEVARREAQEKRDRDEYARLQAKFGAAPSPTETKDE